MTSESASVRAASGAGQPEAIDVLLADGAIARLRTFVPADAPAVKALHDAAPESSIVSRFFSPSRVAAERYVDHLCESPPEEVTALLAEVDHELVALATAERIRRDTAEVSFFVSEAAKGHGVATLLLEHLAARGRGTGVRRFVAEVLLGNHAMQKVLTAAGFETVRSLDSGVVHLELDTAATERAIRAADRRECAAEARSLAPLTRPALVAVTGVHGDDAAVGRAVLASIIEGGFTGELVVVGPEDDNGSGPRSYPAIARLPENVDLLVACVPNQQLASVVEDAAHARVRCTVLVSSGSAGPGVVEPGDRQGMVRVAREYGMRLVGPDSLGVCGFDPAVRLHATFAQGLPAHGGLAVASQSGGVGVALMEAARRHGVGLSSFVSLGGKVDVSGNDLLACWMEDDRVRAAALYLESFGNPRKFARLAKRFSERKPLLAMVGGLSARAHGTDPDGAATAVATSGTAAEAVFTQAGVIATRSLEELVDTAKLLDCGHRPRGHRLGIVANAGGLGRLAADSARYWGLEVPATSSHLARQLDAAGVPLSANPVDLGAASTARAFGASVRLLVDSAEFDSVLVVFTATRVGDTAGALAAVGAAAAESDLPVLLVVHGEETALPGEPGTLTAFSSVESATRALANTVGYCSWLSAPEGSRTEAVAASEEARRTVRRVLGAHPNGTWVDAGTACALLGAYGVTAPGQMAADPKTAAEAADHVGWPVVMKVADPLVRHRSDRGLVATDLTTGEEVRAAVARFAQVLGTQVVPVLVQPVVRGAELAVAVTRDALFGPVVTVAAGGATAARRRDDRVYLVPPVTDLDVARAVRSFRFGPLPDGTGEGAGSVAAVEDVVLAVSRLAEDVPEIAEAELDPVLVGPGGAVCVDVRIRVAPDTSDRDAGVPRRLGPPR